MGRGMYGVQDRAGRYCATLWSWSGSVPVGGSSAWAGATGGLQIADRAVDDGPGPWLAGHHAVRLQCRLPAGHHRVREPAACPTDVPVAGSPLSQRCLALPSIL